MQSCFKVATVFTCLGILTSGGIANAQRPGFSGNPEDFRRSIRTPSNSGVSQSTPRSRPSAAPAPAQAAPRPTSRPSVSISNGPTRSAPSRYTPPQRTNPTQTQTPRITVPRTNPVARTIPAPQPRAISTPRPAPTVVRTNPVPQSNPRPSISNPTRVSPRPSSTVINTPRLTPGFSRPTRPTSVASAPIVSPPPSRIELQPAPAMVTRTETPRTTPSNPGPSRPSFSSNRFPRLTPVTSDSSRPSLSESVREPQSAPAMVPRTESLEATLPNATNPDRPSRPNSDRTAPAMVTTTKNPEATLPNSQRPDRPSRLSGENITLVNPSGRPSRPGNGSMRPMPGDSPIPADVASPLGGTVPKGIMINPGVPRSSTQDRERIATTAFPPASSYSSSRPGKPSQGDFSRRPQQGSAIPAVGLINLENTGPRSHRQSPQSPLDLSQMIARLRGVGSVPTGPSEIVKASPVVNRVVRVSPSDLSFIRYGNNLNGGYNGHRKNYDRCEYFRPVLTPHHRALISIQLGSPNICPPYALHHGYIDPCRPYCIPAPPFVPDYCSTPYSIRNYSRYYTIPDPSPQYSTFSIVPAVYPAPYSPPAATAVPFFGYGTEGDPNALSYQVDASSQLSTNEVNFLKNSTGLADGEDNVFLYNLAAALNSPELIDFKFVIEGHASAEGSAAANQNLSQLRANAIFDFLVNQGVAASRLLAVGHGEQQAVYQPTDPDYLRAKDRRVIIYKLANDSN